MVDFTDAVLGKEEEDNFEVIKLGKEDTFEVIKLGKEEEDAFEAIKGAEVIFS